MKPSLVLIISCIIAAAVIYFLLTHLSTYSYKKPGTEQMEQITIANKFHVIDSQYQIVNHIIDSLFKNPTAVSINNSKKKIEDMDAEIARLKAELEQSRLQSETNLNTALKIRELLNHKK